MPPRPGSLRSLDGVRRVTHISHITSENDPAPIISVFPQQLDGAAGPFMYVSMSPVQVASGNLLFASYTFGSGSVWMPAQLFAPESPESSYFGISVESGTIQLSNPLFPTSDPVANVSLTRTSTNSGSGGTIAGAYASFQSPLTISFTFHRTKAVLVSASDSETTIFGTNTILPFQAGQAFYDTTWQRLTLPLQNNTNSFEVLEDSSSLAKFSGTASIENASWILPLAISSTAQFPQADGAGE